MGADEYMYFSLSQVFPNIESVRSYDPDAGLTNNVVYLWLAHFLWQFAVDVTLTVRVIQAMLFIGTAAIFYVISRHLLQRGPALIATTVLLLSALSSYSAYFIPETLYFFLFYGSIAIAITLAERPLLFAISMGALCALIVLTKPHGVAILVAVLFTLALCIAVPHLLGYRRGTATLAVVLCLAAFYICLIATSASLTGRFGLNPLPLIGDYYANFWMSRPKLVAPFSNFAQVAVGNAFAIALLMGLPLLYIGQWLWGEAKKTVSSGSLDRKARLLALLAVSILAAAVGMTVYFTMQVGGTELTRIHGRYYSFVFPLLVLLVFVAWERREPGHRGTEFWRVSAVVYVATLSIAQFFWRKHYTIEPFDFPELFSLTSWGWTGDAENQGTILIVAGAVACVVIFVRPNWAMFCIIAFAALLGIASLRQTTKWQFAHSAAFARYTDTASALHKLIPPDKLDQGLIVSTSRGSGVYLLVNLRSRSRFVIQQLGSMIGDNLVGPAEWILLDGDFDLRADKTKLVMRRDELSFFVRPGPGWTLLPTDPPRSK